MTNVEQFSLQDLAIVEGFTRQLKILEETEHYESSLYDFLKEGWKYIDPAPFVGGWHLEAIAEHLEAVAYGHIRRLLINIPPRCSKSSLCAVAWSAWVWAQTNKGMLSGPQVQFLYASYAEKLSLRDSIKTRRLIESPWYQKYWGHRFKLTGDQNTKTRFDNDVGGYRIATSVGGTLTGEGGSILVVDDAHKADEVESEVVRRGVIDWWDEVFTTRLNDPKTGAMVVVGHRVHQDDLSNHLLEESDFTHLCLPMMYEKDRHCVTVIGVDEDDNEVNWEDPRSQDGELLCEGRYGETELLDHQKRSYVWAGQFQQRPRPKGGGIIKEEYWQYWKEEKFPRCDYVIAVVDTAFTEKDENCPSAISIWGTFREEVRDPKNINKVLRSNPKVMCIYAWEKWLQFHELVTALIDTCTVDNRMLDREGNFITKHRFPVDRLLIEGKANGISVAHEIKRLVGQKGKFGIEIINPSWTGDKTARVHSIEHLFEEGLIYIPWSEPFGYDWANKVIDRCASFRPGSNKGRTDIVDTVSMGLRYLRDTGFALKTEEFSDQEAEEVAYKPRLQPLYPIA
jgi:predicted phage terminase large subunit-like protein